MKKVFILFTIITLFASCSNDDRETNNSSADTYDRTAMLTHWANNIIIPGFESLNTESSTLNTAIETFVATPNEENLATAKTAWLNTYTQFQKVSMFEIGKAEEIRFRNNLNTYPTDIEAVNKNISTPSISLELSSETDAQGFPAIEYLLYGVGNTPADVVEFYTIDANAEANKAYLKRITNRLRNLVQQVNEDWQGNYATTFINNSGTGATSSVNKVVNDYLFYYERNLRAGKVGIPAGVFSSVLPNNVECVYEGEHGKQMLQTALMATQDFFNGVSATTPSGGNGLADYINHLNIMRDGEQLSTKINTQFNSSKTVINNLSNNLKTQVETDNTIMLTAYDELQKNVVLLKVDMMQALNIALDYVDADGD